jgi:hypothetical protein
MKDYEDRTMSYQEILEKRQQMIRETEEFLNNELIPSGEVAGINQPLRTASSLPEAFPGSDILEPSPMCNYAYRRN